MPETFKITAPDGAEYKITTPDGTSEDRAMEYFQTQYQPDMGSEQDYQEDNEFVWTGICLQQL